MWICLKLNFEMFIFVIASSMAIFNCVCVCMCVCVCVCVCVCACVCVYVMKCDKLVSMHACDITYKGQDVRYQLCRHMHGFYAHIGCPCIELCYPSIV